MLYVGQNTSSPPVYTAVAGAIAPATITLAPPTTFPSGP